MIWSEAYEYEDDRSLSSASIVILRVFCDSAVKGMRSISGSHYRSSDDAEEERTSDDNHVGSANRQPDSNCSAWPIK